MWKVKESQGNQCIDKFYAHKASSTDLSSSFFAPKEKNQEMMMNLLACCLSFAPKKNAKNDNELGHSLSSFAPKKNAKNDNELGHSLSSFATEAK